MTTTKYDGKETPIVGNSPYGDAAAMTRVDANTVKTVYKKGVKVTTTQTLSSPPTERRARSPPKVPMRKARPSTASCFTTSSRNPEVMELDHAGQVHRAMAYSR